MEKKSKKRRLATGSRSIPKIKKRKCEVCDCEFDCPNFFAHERSDAHRKKGASRYDDDIDHIAQAFSNRLDTFMIRNKYHNILNFFEEYQQKIIKLLNAMLVKHTSFRAIFSLNCTYVKVSSDQEIAETFAHYTKTKLFTMGDNI